MGDHIPANPSANVQGSNSSVASSTSSRNALLQTLGTRLSQLRKNMPVGAMAEASPSRTLPVRSAVDGEAASGAVAAAANSSSSSGGGGGGSSVEMTAITAIQYSNSNSNSNSSSSSSSSSSKQPASFNPASAIEPHILAKLDPEWLSLYVEQMLAHPPPPREKMTIEAIRANEKLLAPPCYLDTKGYPRTVDKEVISEDGEAVPVRMYYPDAKVHGPGPYPVHLNFHGGGFVLGSLGNESTLCLSMCNGAGVVVVDVNYRHCPETVWGKCFQDAFAVLQWVRSKAGPLSVLRDSVSLGGISAGGTITLVLSHLARDAQIPLRLIMPSVAGTTRLLTHAHLSESRFHSVYEFYRGPVLPWASIKWFGSLALPRAQLPALEEMWPAWWFAPLDAPNWDGLCPAFIRTGECDPLRDEGEAYGRKLVEAGVQTTFKRYRGSVHTFMYFQGTSKKREYDADAIAALKEAHFGKH